MLSNPHTPTLKFITFLAEAGMYTQQQSKTLINNGGCGIYAQFLYDNLLKLGLSPIIKVIYTNKGSDSAERNLVEYLQKGINLEHAGADHIVVQLEDAYFDSDGLCSCAALWARRTFDITEEQLEALIAHAEWNSEFDRSRIDVIRETLAACFDDFIGDRYTPGMYIHGAPDHMELTDYTARQRALHSRMSMFNSLFAQP